MSLSPHFFRDAHVEVDSAGTDPATGGRTLSPIEQCWSTAGVVNQVKVVPTEQRNVIMRQCLRRVCEAMAAGGQDSAVAMDDLEQ